MNGGPRRMRRWCTAVTCCLALTAARLLEAPAFAHTAGIMDAAAFTTTNGRQIYEHVCRGCHMPNAGGAIGAGRYPALANNPALMSRRYMALTILTGRRNMPAFGAGHAVGYGGPAMVLSAVQIAAVTNYVRSHFGNHFKDPITAAEVQELDPAPR